MTIAASGGRDVVSGRRIAMVAVGPIPGRIPMNVPSIAPRKQNIRFVGDNASEKPSIKK
jgi:hypothetical protein